MKVEVIKEDSSLFGEIGEVTKDLGSSCFVKFDNYIYREFKKSDLKVLSRPKQEFKSELELFVIEICGRYLNPTGLDWTLTRVMSDDCLLETNWIIDNCPELLQFAHKVKHG